MQSPTIPYVSNVTGTWITASDVLDPMYWTKHLRQTVRFADGLQAILQTPRPVLLEVGPGQALSVLAKQHSNAASVITSMRHPLDQKSDVAVVLHALGKLWLAGATVDWFALHAHSARRRVSLPTYPFERQRYWIESRGMLSAKATAAPSEHTNQAPANYERPPLSNDFVAPRNDVEYGVAAIWQELFGLQQVGVYDSFFDLGGHSLLATQLMSRLHAAFEIDLPLSTIFEAPTVAALAERIVKKQAEQVDIEALEQMLADIQDLSPDDLRMALEAERQLMGR